MKFYEYNVFSQALGWVITPGAMAPCEHCARVKPKQKNVVKSSKSESKATKPGERVYLDLSKVTVAGDNGVLELNRKNWKLMVDECTGKKFSEFTETKSGMVEPTCELLNKMKARAFNSSLLMTKPLMHSLCRAVTSGCTPA